MPHLPVFSFPMATVLLEGCQRISGIKGTISIQVIDRKKVERRKEKIKKERERNKLDWLMALQKGLSSIITGLCNIFILGVFGTNVANKS